MPKQATCGSQGQMNISKVYGFYYFNSATKAAESLAEVAKKQGYDRQEINNKNIVKPASEKE